MAAASDSGTNRGPFGGLARWWRHLRTTRTAVNDLIGAGTDVQTVTARDLGVSTAELHALAGAGPGTADQLGLRLRAQHIDADTLERNDPVMRDLERTCTLCGAKRQCERDLARTPDDPVWRTYCPNAHTLDALEADSKRHR